MVPPHYRVTLMIPFLRLWLCKPSRGMHRWEPRSSRAWARRQEGPAEKNTLMKCFIFKTHVNFTFAPKFGFRKENILDYLAVEVLNILLTNLAVKRREPRSDSVKLIKPVLSNGWKAQPNTVPSENWLRDSSVGHCPSLLGLPSRVLQTGQLLLRASCEGGVCARPPSSVFQMAFFSLCLFTLSSVCVCLCV